MSRFLPLAAAVFSLVLASCDDGRGVSTLSPSLSVSPREITLERLWVGYPTTVTATVTNTGTAPLSGLLTAVTDEVGQVDVTASLRGDALAPGASVDLDVTLAAAPGSFGAYSANVVVDAGADGAAAVALHAEVRDPPSCDDGNPCTEDRFLPDLGACSHESLDDGSSCDDGSACTTADACLAGRCVGEAVSCVDDVGCTLDACDPAVGCVFAPQHDRCADEDPCTEDVCAPLAGCQNPPLEEGGVCHFAGCAEIGLCFAGQCVITEVPDGLPCEDGDACTAGDTCLSGECSSGPELGVGAAPPLVVDPTSLTLDLCHGPDPGPDCYGFLVDEPGLERVLAVDRVGDRLRLVWQGGYVDNWNAPCDPTDLLFEPIAIDPPEEEPPAPEGPGAGARRPPRSVCAAGVYLTSFDLGVAVNPPSTQQLTTVIGPAAAAFVPTLGALANGAADGAAEDPAQPPPPPLSPAPSVVVVHPNFFRTSVWVEERTEDGASLSSARRTAPWSASEPVAGLAVAVDEHRTVVVAHVGRVELPNEVCEAEGCDVVSVPLWVFGEPRSFGDGGFDRVVMLPRSIDAHCNGVTPGSLPFDVHDLTVFASGAMPRVSFRMSRSVCGDVAPGTLGLPADAAALPSVAAWWFEVNPALSNLVPEVIAPLESYVMGDESLASFRTTSEGAAAALVHVPVQCGCEPCDIDFAEEEGDCACLPVAGTCFDTVVERTLDVVTAPSEVLLSSFGGALRGQTVPLVVEGELRVATLLGPHMELLGTDSNGVLSRIVAPSPPDLHQWDLTAPLLPGPPESMVVVGGGISSMEPVWPPSRQALVQVFGCGLGDAPSGDDVCLEDFDCDDGLGCDRSVCLPGPECASEGTCDLCWGRCAEPAADDDAGVPEDGGVTGDDGGLFDDDGGFAQDDGGVGDGG